MATQPTAPDFRTQVLNVIPIGFLTANDAQGATGPSVQTDAVQAIRDVVAAGRRVAQRARVAEDRLCAVEQHVREFILALDRGYLSCRDDSAFIDALRTIANGSAAQVQA